MIISSKISFYLWGGKGKKKEKLDKNGDLENKYFV